jgi:hypothetical protein
MSTVWQVCDGYNKGTLMGIERLIQVTGTKRGSLITRNFVISLKIRRSGPLMLASPLTMTKASSVQCHD